MYEMATGNPPFQSANLEEMAENIRFGDLPMNRYISEQLEDLIQRLTHKQPENRLGVKNGAQDIKNHPFFRGVNWDDVIQKKTKPPIVPAKKAQ